jgi:hypothetical protein
VCWEFCPFSRRQLALILTRNGRDSVVSICIIGLWIQSSLRSMSCAARYYRWADKLVRLGCAL